MTAWKKRRTANAERQVAQTNLRNQFAAAALSGICAHITGVEKRAGETGPQAHARWAIEVAELMMKGVKA